MGAIRVAQVALGPKPRRHDSIGGTRDTIDFMDQVECGLQAGGGGHFETIMLEKRGTLLDEGAAVDHWSEGLAPAPLAERKALAPDGNQMPPVPFSCHLCSRRRLRFRGAYKATQRHVARI